MVFKEAGAGVSRAVAIACLTVFLCSCGTEKAPPQPSKPANPTRAGTEGGSAPVIDTPKPKVDFSDNSEKETVVPQDCDILLGKIVPVFQAIPDDLRNLKADKADELARKVELAILDCEKFLATCTSNSSTAAVHFYQAKFLQVLSSRVRTQVINDMSASENKFTAEDIEDKLSPFYRRVSTHAVKSTEGLDNKSALKPHAIEIRAWAHTLLKEHQKAKEDYRSFLAIYPDSPRNTVLTAALGRVLSTLEEYDAGIKLVEEKMAEAKVQDSPDFPTLGETRWKLYEAKGDPAGLLRSAERVLRDYRPRIKNPQYSAKTREAYSRYLSFNGFRKGYSLMALGRMDDARDAFNEHVNETNLLQKELEKRGLSLKPAISIYCQRSENALGFLDDIALRPAADFDLGEMWVTEKKTRLKDTPGKVVALLFRGADDARSATFMKDIDQFAEANDELEMVSIHFFKGAKNIDQQLDSLREELLTSGYSGAAGFDPDLAKRGLFRAWGVYVGSATFLIINQQGQPVWFQQDPRTRDANLIKAILGRVLASG